MSDVKRDGLIFAINQIGKAFNAYDSLVGDTYTPYKYAYYFENNLTRARGSKIFFDYDVSKKDPYSDNLASFNTFESNDIANFVLQGGEISVKKEQASFLNTGNWFPENYSPISPEGWGIYDYNAWSNYIPKYNSSGTANTDLLIYNTLSEPGNGVSRTSFDYPVRYSGYGFTYSRVPLFNHSMWCSVKNFSSYSSVDEIRFVISKADLHGVLDSNPFTGAPNDILFYSHKYLCSSNYSSSMNLSGSMGILNESEKLDLLAFDMKESTSIGEVDQPFNKNYYLVNLKLPSGIAFTSNYWFHFLIYWGSQDSYVQTIKPNYSSQSNNLLETFYYDFPESYKRHSRKNFFNNSIKSTLDFNKSGIFDTSIYLYDNNNIDILNKEKQYIDKKSPLRYKIDEIIPNTFSSKNNSLLGFKSIGDDEYFPFIIAGKKTGLYYDKPNISLEFFYDNVISSEDSPIDWSTYKNWPIVPDDYSVIGKIVCKKSAVNLNLKDSNLLSNDLDIIYIENVPQNILKKGISDESFARYFTRALFQTSSRLRIQDYNKYFTYFAQKLITRFTDYDTSQLRNFNQFSNFNSNQYLVLHNYLKLPKGENFANESEPVAFQFNEYAANLIGLFGSIPSPTNVAGFASTKLYLENYNFKNGAKFEIYYEKNTDTFDNHIDDNANGIEDDYCFKLKFVNKSNQFVIKNLFVNSSKFYITQNEYDERVSKGLSIDGYFTSGNINNLTDFKINSYASCIPDLKMGEFRDIINKQNSPINSLRITESEYESYLSALNPSITKDDLINAKFGFGLTDSFYVVDQNSPDNSYKSLKEIGLTISRYDSNNSKWIDNSSHLYGLSINNDIKKPLNIKDLRFDSFIISSAGYTDSDNSIRLLENFGNQQVISNSSSQINKSEYEGSVSIDNNKTGLRISCDITQEIKGFSLKLKNTSSYINENSTIKAEIWSDKNNAPDSILAIGSEINLKSLNENFQDFYFYIDFKFFKDINYWLVLNVSQMPPLYDPFINGLVSIANTSVVGLYNAKNDTYANFENYLTGSEIGFGSTSGLAITTWYPITSIGSSTNLIFSGNGLTVDKIDYSIKYKFLLAIVESSSTGASSNLSSYSSIGWTSKAGTGYVQFYKPDTEIYAAFNKDFTNSTLILPPPNKFREQNDYHVNEFLSFTNSKFINAKNLYIYPRSIYLKETNFIASGNDGSNFLTVSPKNFKDDLMIGIFLQQNNHILAGTSITNIIYDRSSKNYKLFLSTKLFNTFAEQDLSTSSNQNILVRRANDINVYLSYDTNFGIGSTTITLEKNPTWLTRWYKSSKSKYNILRPEDKANYITATHNLNFENYDLDLQIDYLNGYSVGEFYPKASLGTTFDFKFFSSNGVRVFINDSSSPILDNWFNNSSIGNTFSLTLNSISEKIKFKVDFNHAKTESGVGLTLVGYYKKSSNANWLLFDDSFYIDNLNYGQVIDQNLISNLNFMNVSNDLKTFEKKNYGSPINDNLVIRTI